MFAMELSTSMLCARAILGTRSSDSAVILRARSFSSRSAPARRPEAINTQPTGMRSSWSGRGLWTPSTSSAPARAASADGATRAPASRYSASWKPEARPASDSTETSIPAFTIFSTVAGTAATLFSPSASSLTTAAFIRRAPCRSPAGDVDVQLIDEELLLVEHQADQVAHADQPDDHAASLDRDRPDLLLRHELRRLAAGRGGLEADDVPDHVPLDGGHARAPCATGSTLSNCEPGVKLL